MEHLGLVCLSLTPNLRCIGFTMGQFTALVIPPAIEVVTSSLFIYLYSGPCRWPQILLVTDTMLYFVWALLDMLSHSSSVFKVLDIFVGAVSFTPIFIYSIYVYRLSCHDFIPTLPRRIQPYLKIALPILTVVAVTLNALSSFIGTHIGTFDHRVIVKFSNNSESLWLSLSRTSLAVYTVIQLLFFLLACSRLSKAFLDQRRIELTHSDERHFFHGITWINSGIVLGLIEVIIGFARISFDVALTRRILRLVARTTLMFGLLKGLDFTENFENLVDELRGVPGIAKRISDMLGVSPRRATFRQALRTRSQLAQVDERLSDEKQGRRQRVTVHYEKGQAPFLQIRFSTLDFPAQTVVADTIKQRRRSLSGTMGCIGGGNDASHEIVAARNAMLGTSRAKSQQVSGIHLDVPDWIQPPERSHFRQGSGGTISDTLSIVRDLERRFPNIPPRVTGKYRGSILGENYEDDPFPVVGISRQSSLRYDTNIKNPGEDGGTPVVALSASGSIKRKPAPPLLDNIACISDKRPASTWGGLTENTVHRSPDSSMVPNSEPAPTREPTFPTTPKSRRRTARDLIKRASRALSDASIHSAEWFASGSSPQSDQIPLTAADIEMYRRGSLGPGTTRPKLRMKKAGSSCENLAQKGRSRANTRASQP